jgi:hypothetical protein
MFGPEGLKRRKERNLHNEELHVMLPLPNIMRMIWLRRMK